jgi:hypothetical protein
VAPAKGFEDKMGHHPSSLSKRVPIAALSAIGAALAGYLTCYQLGLIDSVWEPFFGNGSRTILRDSAIARFLPVPDAALGIVAYALEAILELIGNDERYRSLPIAPLAVGAVAAGLALTAVGLVASQIFWFHAFCTLCLLSAAISLSIAVMVAPEVWMAWGTFKESRRSPAA